MTVDELITLLEAAPEGTRELGVAVLEAIGARVQRSDRMWVVEGNYRFAVRLGEEARVVTDLNFRLPGVPAGILHVDGPRLGLWHVMLLVAGGSCHQGLAHTEALARIIVELKAIMAGRE